MNRVQAHALNSLVTCHCSLGTGGGSDSCGALPINPTAKLWPSMRVRIEYEQGVEKMLFTYEGQRVPPATFRVFTQMGWYQLSMADLFEQKNVVVFAVPGAFTCPYSPIQLLGYNQYADVF